MKSLSELMNLSGRVAVITGGTGHIGRVLADALAELGAAIVVLDVSPDACEAEARRIEEQHGVRALPRAIELRERVAVREVPEVVGREFGRLDILVNCAAMHGSMDLEGWASPFEEQSVELWREALEVNLTAPFVLIQACCERLVASGHGSIINVGSIYGMVGPDWRMYADTPMGNPAAYGASKGGLLQLTRWLATTLAPRVRVNAITPGGVFRNPSEPFLSQYVDRTPLRRMANEEDIKGAIAYLASDLSAYVTGHNLVVDGGWTAW